MLFDGQTPSVTEAFNLPSIFYDMEVTDMQFHTPLEHDHMWNADIWQMDFLSEQKHKNHVQYPMKLKYVYSVYIYIYTYKYHSYGAYLKFI